MGWPVRYASRRAVVLRSPGFGIRVVKEIFDDEGRLKVFTPDEWQSEWISRYTLQKQSNADDDEIPF